MQWERVAGPGADRSRVAHARGDLLRAEPDELVPAGADPTHPRRGLRCIENFDSILTNTPLNTLNKFFSRVVSALSNLSLSSWVRSTENMISSG